MIGDPLATLPLLAHTDAESTHKHRMISPAEQPVLMYNTEALAQVLNTMAAGLAQRLHGRSAVTLVGIRRRGAPLAHALLSRLRSRLAGVDLARLDLLVKRYADDLTLLHPKTLLTEAPEHASIDLSQRTVVLIDDVLYQGFSLNKALQYLLGKGAHEVITAVLVDRVCTSLPVHADIAGLKLQVAPEHVVECHVPPFEEDFAIVLTQAASG